MNKNYLTINRDAARNDLHRLRRMRQVLCLLTGKNQLLAIHLKSNIYSFSGKQLMREEISKREKAIHVITNHYEEGLKASAAKMEYALEVLDNLTNDQCLLATANCQLPTEQ